MMDKDTRDSRRVQMKNVLEWIESNNPGKKELIHHVMTLRDSYWIKRFKLYEQKNVLYIPTSEEILEIDSTERFCAKCKVSENKQSVSYATGLCDTCWEKVIK